MKNLRQIFRQALLALVMAFSAHVYAINISYPLNLALGWNLLGNSLNTPLDVRATLGAEAQVVSVWKWDPVTRSWAFYSPSLDATPGALQSYADSMGYSVLTSVAPGEAYWVNTTGALALGVQAGVGFALTPAQLVVGWNLTATADDVSPNLLANSIGNVITLWAWDNATSKWYFHAPSLQASGAIASYIAGNGYKDFAAMTLGNGVGFWLNYAGNLGGTANSSTPACLISAGSAKICYDSLPAPFSCDATGMNDSTWALDYAGYTGKSYQALASCTGSGYNMAGTVFTTVASDAVVLTPFGTTLSVNGDYLDATGNAARFSFSNGFGTASGITWDGSFLWVADTGNRVIRKLDPVSGAVSTLNVLFTNPDTGQTGNPLVAPKGIASDSANLYVTDQRSIYQIAKSSGAVTILSGSYNGQVPGGWGTVRVGTLPATSSPTGITSDGTSLYISDLNPASVIKMDLASKVFTTLATLPTDTFTAAGPRGITTAGGNLYVVSGADKTIVRINIATGAKTTLAGNPNASTLRDGVGAEAVFLTPTDISTDGTFLYVTDTNNDYPGSADSPLVRRIEISTGVVTSLTRGAGMGFADGGWNEALFNGLGAITNIGSTLYVTDNLSAVRKIVYGAAAAGIGNVVTPVVPVAPTGVSASTTSASSIQVSWSAVNNATGYLVYRGTTIFQALSAMTRLTASPIVGTSYSDTGLAAGTYYYKVVATNAVGPGAASSEVSANTLPPGAPSSLTAANAGNGSIGLNWTASAGATGYDVYRSSTAGQPYASMTRLTASPISATSYTDAGLASLSVYYYKVVASNLVGSMVSSEASAPSSLPGTPTGLTATVNGANAIDLSWSSVSGASGYDVYRSTSPGQATGVMTKLTAFPTTGITWADSGLSAATSYYYKVVSLASGIASAPSSEAFASTPAAPSAVGTQMGGARQGVTLSLAGAVTTFAPSGTISAPRGIASDGLNLYVAGSSSNQILKIVIATGAVTILAGSGTAGSVNGTGTSATFNDPVGITTDGTNLYVVESGLGGNRIRKIVIASGVVTTFAGTGAFGAVEGAGASATFNGPYGITTDGTNLYVADTGNSKIRKVVIGTGVVSTLAGSGSYSFADGTGTAASFNSPYGLTTDGTKLYVADSANNRVRQIDIASRVVTTVAGSGTAGTTDGTGILATFKNPQGITTDGTNLYVTDTSGHMVRRVVISSGVVSQVAGGGVAGNRDGTGTAARFSSPAGLTTDGVSVFVADTGNNKVRKIQ